MVAQLEDKSKAIRVTVSASPEEKPLEHTITATVFRGRAGKELTSASIDKLEKAGTNSLDEEGDPVVVSRSKYIMAGGTGNLTLTGNLTATAGADVEVEAVVCPVKPLQTNVDSPSGQKPGKDAGAQPTESEPQPFKGIGNNSLTLADYETIPNPKNPFFGRKPYRMDGKTYGIVVVQDTKWRTQVAGVNKRTGEWKWLELPKNDEILFEPMMGDDVTAFIQHGNPISQLVVYNGRANKWSTFPVQGHAIDVVPCVGDRMVSFHLPDRVVAYSATRDAWGSLKTDAEPAVGDDAVWVETAKGRYEFPDKNGAWAAVSASAVSGPQR
jgi:hypothetical protein